MKKIFIKKMIGAILLISICFNMIINSYVQATTLEETNVEQSYQKTTASELDDILETEEKVMMYDATTNETTEVDMEQLREELYSRRGVIKNGIAEPYYSSQFESKNMIKRENIEGDNLPGEPADVHLDLVPDTFRTPNRAVCKITTTAESGGTCAIIGPNIGLTAAHCVFNKDRGNLQYSNWQIHPGYNGGECFGDLVCGWSRVFYSNNWMEHNNDNRFDWAIVILEKDVGTQLGYYFGAQSYGNNSELKDLQVRNYGYPETDIEWQHTAWGMIRTVDNYMFDYKGISRNGMSGGPIVKLDNVGTIVGIIDGIRDINNQPTAVRISQTMIDIILSNR